MFVTRRCFVVGITLNNGEWLFNVTANGLNGGAFRARFMEDKICVMDQAFKSSTNDEAFEREIFQEVFRGLMQKEELPLYFNAKRLSVTEKTLLKEMGAEEVIEVKHAWPEDINIVKLEVTKNK